MEERPRRDAAETGRPMRRGSPEKEEVNSQVSLCQVSRCGKVSHPGPGSEQRPYAAEEAALTPRPAALLLLGLFSSCSGGSGTRSLPGSESG